MGDLSPLNSSIKNKIKEVIDSTKNNTGLIVNIGLNYGGKTEIIRAINLILDEKRDKTNLSKKIKKVFR